MLAVLSPAKSLDYSTASHIDTVTEPQFLESSAQLMKVLQGYDVPKLAQLMRLSDSLAALNVARNHQWQAQYEQELCKQAILAFDGDVYAGFDAKRLSCDQLQYAQEKVRILSGLYGILRPLDWMRPYRLEMGTTLVNAKGKDLYAFWQDALADNLNHELQQHQSQYLINLASDEYFKAVSLQVLSYPVIQPVFQDAKNGAYKVISFFAKRARGLMARYIVENKIDQPELLKNFREQGYRYLEEKIAKNGVVQWIFVRD